MATGEAVGIDVSVIVCTRDRVESLRRTVASIGRSRIPADISAELLVVDNGSAAGATTSLVLPDDGVIPLRVVHEPRPGLSRARNRALQTSRGRVLVWTDDDVVVDADWVWRMAEPILSGRADAIAGRVEIPLELRERARGTALEHRLGLLAATELDDWTAPPWLVGASMAFGRAVLERVEGFDERLGAGPESLGFHEEGLFAWRLRDAGYRLAGAPDAVVHHHFDPDRLEPAAILRMAERFGRSTAYVDWHWRHLPPLRLLWLRRLRADCVRRWRRSFGSPAAATEGDFVHASAVAYFDEIRRVMGQPRKYRRRPT